jgi:preprotein translocase SecE subunit
VPRDRQRAKQRQAQRRAARLAGDGHGEGRSEAAGAPTSAELEANAPPEEVGRSDTVVRPSAEAPGVPDLSPSEPALVGRVDGADAAARAPEDHERPERGRVIAFLVAVVAELRRVQWPDRATLTTLTGVVLGFVLLAGGYLGLLDYIFSRLVRALL